MAVNLGTAYAELTLNSTGFTTGLAAAQTSLKTFKNQASLVASGLQGVGTAMTKAGSTLTKTVTTPLVAMGAAAVKTGMDFDEGMSKVAAISGATGEDLDRLRAKAREMGATTKFTATESAEALNYMAMAGWKTEEMLDGLEGIMYLAAASGEDLGRTSDIVTDALTAFGMEAKDSSHFADVLAAAAANSNTNVAMMGETFKYAAPTAGALGYSIEDVAVAIGLMGNSGIKASRAGTSLNNIFTRMAKQPKEAAEAMSRLGLALYDSEGRMYSFMEIMQQMRGAFGHINMPVEQFNAEVAELDKMLELGSIKQEKYNKELEELIKQAYGAEGAEKARAAAMLAGQRGMAGLLAIVNSTEEEFNSLTEAIYHASDGEGMAAKQAAIMMDNLKGKLTILKSALQELAIEIYEVILPHMDALVTKAQEVVQWFQNLSTEQKEQIVKWAGIAAAVGPALLIFGKVLTSLGSIITAGIKISSWLGSLGEAFGLVSAGAEGASGTVAALGASFGWIAAVVAAVVGLGVALKKLYDEGGQFTESVNNIKDKLVGDFNALVENVKQAWESFKAYLQPAIETIKSSFNFEDVDGAMSKLVDAFSRLYDALKPVIETLMDVFVAVVGPLVVTAISTIVGAINGIITALEPLINVITDVVNIVTDAVNVVVGLIQGLVTGDFTLLTESAQSLCLDLESLVNDVIATIVAAVEGFFSGFGATFSSFTGITLNDVTNFFTELWNTVSSFFTETIPEAFNTFINETVPNFIESVGTWFDQLPEKIGFALGYAIQTLINWGQEIHSWISNTLPTIINNIENWFKQLPQRIKTWLTDTITIITTWGVNMQNKATEVAKDFVNRFIDWVKTLPDKVHSWVSSIPNKVLSIKDSMYSAGASIINSLWEGMKHVWDSISDWFDSVMEKIGSLIDSVKDGMAAAKDAAGGGGSHADGLAYVPYNGYRATLHEGERVLTKNEAQAYNSGGSGNYTFNYYSPTAIDPYEANRLLKQTVRQMEEGFT